MSNHLSVRRVKVQTLDEQGNPEGEPTFGVMAADSYGQAYDDTFESFNELNEEIKRVGCILDIVDAGTFCNLDTENIGTENFCDRVDIY